MSWSAQKHAKNSGVKIAAEELPDVPVAPRQPFIAREDVVLVWSMVVSIPTFAAAALAACLVVRSGAHLIWAGVAATIAAVAAGWLGVQVTRAFARKRIRDLAAQLTSRDLVLLVRVRSAGEEAKATQILLGHGAQAVRPHEIAIDKRLEHLPLHSLRVNSWLGDEPLVHLPGAARATRPNGLNRS